MTIFASRLRSIFFGSKHAECLRAYFRSGWAFLIPYLAAYLLYAWLKWPVNPAVTGAEGMEQGARVWVPCLLHVYWALHGIHVGLAGAALRVWWKSVKEEHAAGSKEQVTETPLPDTGYRSPRHSPEPAERASAGPLSPFSLFPKAAPWFCLMLLFYIPGIYLEWPSDPWEHLRRINEWHMLDTVTAHSAWKKSSYFLPYSLTGHTYGLSQLTWLNFYYTGICLLLSWQYYRLARAVGLGERASFVFVLLNAVTFGNNIFSFYRYYGLSSSILAQIGAVALTRIALEVAQNPLLSLRALFRFELTAYRLSLIAAVPALLAMTVFNHIQGLGIAGLGVLAVVVWRLIEWKRAMVFWLAGTAIVLSVATVLWFPRHPALDEIYRPQGWLTAWYGFNLFAVNSPAFDRSWQILGALGVANLGSALWLVARKNYAVGWLTLMPVVLLALPCFALPFADALAFRTSSYDNIVAFHRCLFACPMGLALIAALSSARTTLISTAHNASHSSRFLPLTSTPARLPVVPGLLPAVTFLYPVALLTVTLSPTANAYNRFWHSVQVTPDDLQLKHFVAIWNRPHLSAAADDNTLTITSSLGTQIQEALSPSNHMETFRHIHAPAITAELEQKIHESRLSMSRSRPIPSLYYATQSSLMPDASIFPLPSPAPRKPQLIANPTSSASLWLSQDGHAPDIALSPDGNVQISNPTGIPTHVFNSSLIAIDRNQRYRLTCTLRQTGTTSATNFLAVAWYDQNREPLVSNRTAPAGAGSPVGWVNGTYAYYGLIDQPAPTSWTTFTISFGLGEGASIPAHAAFIRIGALLNFRATPNAKIQVKDMSLRQKPAYARAFLALPSLHNLYSPDSLSAYLSGHWPSSKVAAEHADLAELRIAAASLN